MTALNSFDWCCVAAVNRSDILAENLAASPVFLENPGILQVERGWSTAGGAYNSGKRDTGAEIVVFAHQDVYLPRGWDALLAQRIRQLDTLDPNWAVAGVMGIGPGGVHSGHVWSTGLGRELGASFGAPIATTSLDEVLLILKRSSGLSFDPDLPSFHLYGTDIVQMALQAGLGAYVIHAPVIHNSRPVQTLSGGFTEAYHYMQKKWSFALPIQTLVTEIAETDAPLQRTENQLQTRRFLKRVRRVWATARFGRGGVAGRPSPASIASKLGYEGD